MRALISALAVWLALAIATVTGSAAPPRPARLNVLFIAVDDLNTSLGAYGHPIVRSPNIDRLARRGVRFDRAYCQYPLCNPSRTSLLSGLRPETTRIFGNQEPPRTHLGRRPFLPEQFRAHGYFTARVGKIAHGLFEGEVAWDVAPEAGAPHPRPRRRAAAGDRGEDAPAGAGGAPIEWEARDVADDALPDGRTARRIVELIEAHRDRPFFIAAGFHKPHLPFVAPRRYFALYPPDRNPLPEEPSDDRADIPPLALTTTRGDERLTPDLRREAIAAYYACVSFTDAQVGLLLDALDRLRLWDRTVVVLFGDHGFHLGEHGGLWRKMTLFEESARVPLIVAAPGIAPGASSRLVELVDLYPTLAELCGVPTPPALEGTSFVPLLHEPDRPWKRAAYTMVRRGANRFGRSVRTERFRYTEWSDGSAELYDHRDDPREYRNLAHEPRYRGARAYLRFLLHAGWESARPKDPTEPLFLRIRPAIPP